MDKVLLPEDVYLAFENTKKRVSKLSENEQLLIFMGITVTGRQGDSKILRDFAIRDPKKYLKALMFGYSLDKQEVLTNMIKNWLSEPYVEDEENDIKQFAERLTKFFLQN